MCVSLIGRAMCYGHIGTGSSLVYAVCLLNSPYLLTVLFFLKYLYKNFLTENYRRLKIL